MFADSGFPECSAKLSSTGTGYCIQVKTDPVAKSAKILEELLKSIPILDTADPSITATTLQENIKDLTPEDAKKYIEACNKKYKADDYMATIGSDGTVAVSTVALAYANGAALFFALGDRADLQNLIDHPEWTKPGETPQILSNLEAAIEGRMKNLSSADQKKYIENYNTLIQSMGYKATRNDDGTVTLSKIQK